MTTLYFTVSGALTLAIGAMLLATWLRILEWM